MALKQIRLTRQYKEELIRMAEERKNDQEFNPPSTFAMSDFRE